MSMTNGGSNPYVQRPASSEEQSAPSDPPVITVNFGLTARQLLGVGTLLGGLGIGGWFVLPASRDDLTRVEGDLKQLRVTVGDLTTHVTGLQRSQESIANDVRQLQGVNGEIVTAVRELREAVAELSVAPQAPPTSSVPASEPARPRRSTRPRPKTTKQMGIFGLGLGL